MNPWGEDVPKPKTASKDPLIETFEAIQLFERERKDSNIASYRRNDAYWIELKKLHVESLADLADFVEYLNHKKDSHRKQGIALSPTPSTRSSSKAKSSSTKDKDDSGGFNPGAGMQTRKALEEFDSSISAKYIEEADFIEKDLMKTFVSQAASIDSELKALWLRGDRLLFAVKLSDLRSKRNFDTFSHFVSVYSKRPIQNTQTVQKPDIAEVTRAEDIWLAEICYSVAAARSYEIKDECNKQLRFLFARAKDVEIRRRALIAKAGGNN